MFYFISCVIIIYYYRALANRGGRATLFSLAEKLYLLLLLCDFHLNSNQKRSFHRVDSGKGEKISKLSYKTEKKRKRRDIEFNCRARVLPELSKNELILLSY